MTSYSIPLRLKRLRQTSSIRALVREHHLHPSKLIAPLFISETLQEKREIKSMPGHFQLSIGSLSEEIESLTDLGITTVILFGIPAHKDAEGRASLEQNGIIPRAIKTIRQTNPDMVIIADACFCEYTDHGHCGVLKNDLIDNDKTLTLLSKQAVCFAEAGADFIAPSGMADGMVGAIREALDKAHHQNTAILSYAVKYSSSFYGPFREAAEGAPQFGDRKTYQMDPANGLEAIREASLDLEEGADILMVKPAMNYLDVIFRLKQHFPQVPLCAYQVSGEYAMIKTAAKLGLMDEQQAMYESLIAIKRAGADMIMTYFAKEMAKLLKFPV
ncbi:porphobilinogen synthase [Legionella impletisoli]|uniref:Delta-aminolevulinic acid dehydratase n=1 Tax=Legionella impletisoli TaxID=343510 RepID=A0A917NBD2_9GAMM|nr:porphobilinogen synthase [Legionella impletisoli]GGI85294.1 delta-aminolevulinic acid dehydratase [Legionella impletisoli]